MLCICVVVMYEYYVMYACYAMHAMIMYVSYVRNWWLNLGYVYYVWMFCIDDMYVCI